MPEKRKLPPMGLERRVRPRKEEGWEPEPDVTDDSADDDDEVSEAGIGGDDSQEDESGSSQHSESDAESEAEPDAPKPDLSSISFGALARAQASLPPSERESKKQKRLNDPQDLNNDERTTESKRGAKPAPKPKRSSKHAPQEQSSKRPVSRRREVVTETRRAPVRDPRFDTLSSRLDEAKAKKAYAFLDEYRDKELADLRAQAKKTKDPAVKEDLKRQIMSMESRKKARQKKEEEEKLLAEHRKKEKELVAQGKKPFYLKRSEQKKQLLMNRYAGMKKGQVDKTIERKRKKVAGKEKKELDLMQRVTDRRGR